MELILSNHLRTVMTHIDEKFSSEDLNKKIEFRMSYKTIRGTDKQGYLDLVKRSNLFIADQVFFQQTKYKFTMESEEEEEKVKNSSNDIQYGCRSYSDTVCRDVIFEVNNFMEAYTHDSTTASNDQIVLACFQLKSYNSRHLPFGWDLMTAARQFGNRLFNHFTQFEYVGNQAVNCYTFLTMDELEELVKYINSYEAGLSYIIEGEKGI